MSDFDRLFEAWKQVVATEIDPDVKAWAVTRMWAVYRQRRELAWGWVTQ